MSVSEWTEGLKKKEASLIYVNPSVTACAVPAPSAGSLLAFLISFWHKQGDALRPHIFTISHDHPPIGGFHMAEPYFALRKQYFTAHGRNFTAGVSPLFSRLRAVHVRIFAVQAHQLIVRAKAAHKPVFKAKYPVRLHNG